MPLDPEKTVFRIVSIFMVSQPEVRVFGPLADKIGNIHLHVEKIQVPWGPDFVDGFIPVSISWSQDGIDHQLYIPDVEVEDPDTPEDEEETKARDNLRPARLLAGARLVMLHKINWQSLHENNLYVEGEATQYAADANSRLIILSEDADLNRDISWPLQSVFEATSFAQLDKLYTNSQPYRPIDPKPKLGANQLNFPMRVFDNQTPEAALIQFIISHMTIQLINSSQTAKKFETDIRWMLGAALDEHSRETIPAVDSSESSDDE